MNRRWVLIFTALVPAVWAAPALEVRQADGKVLVQATAAKLAAWRPAEDALVVVIPAGSGGIEIGSMPNGVTAMKTGAQGNLDGVLVQGVRGSWQVKQDGANWVIRPGSGSKAESVIMLRDGWRVAGKVLQPQAFNTMGKTWQVALVDEAQSVAGSVAGVVRQGGRAMMAVTPELTPAAKPDMEAEKQPAPIQQVSPKPLAAVQDGKKVVIESAPSLKPLGQLGVAAAALPLRSPASAGQDSLQPVSLGDMLARIEPAAGDEPAPARALPVAPSLTAPHGKAGETTVTPASGLEKVQIREAPAMKPVATPGTSAEEVLPQVLGEVYLPGTVVSLTLPSGGEPHADVEQEMPGAASATVAVSGSWNQVTLAPIEAALAAAAISPTEVSATPVAKVEMPVEEPVVPEAKEVVVNRILPQREGTYNNAASDALQVIAGTQPGTPRERDAQMNLAGIYLSWERPEEALAVLAGLPKRADGLPASPQARLYTAIAKLAHGDQPENGLLDQGGQLGGHGKLWRAVAASEAGDYATALKVWPQERGILPQYPAYLREMAQQAQATALVMVGERSLARQVTDELAAGYGVSGTVPAGLVRLQGLARLGTPDEAEGLQLLARAAEDMSNPAVAYRAKYEFVRALQQRRDLSDDQVTKYLTDLWFDWRGDDLEHDVLNTLAELYDKAGEPREALQYWQILVKAFPKAPDLGRITERMTEAFLRVFDPENPKVYDSLEYLGLYYDFSELVPNDGRGDLVQEQVAKLMVDANLWDRAVPILEQQLRYRPLDLAAQGRLSLMLAEAYGNMGHPAEGIKIIDKWQYAAANTVLQHQWKVLEAQLLLKLNRPDTALKAMAAMPNDNADFRDLRIEAKWMAQKWHDVVPLLQAKLQSVPSAQLVSDTGAQLATFRLAYALGQLQDGPAIDGLSKRYETGIERLPQLADDVAAVAATTGVSASVVTQGRLAPLTTALNNLNRMTERVEATRKSIREEQAQQKEYNDKMRYMELLPPPAI